MDIPLFTVSYLSWHYTRAFRDILSVWFTGMWFVVHFFSMRLLVRTLFAPWRRMADSYERKTVESLLESFVFNTLSRVLGALVRLTLCALGILFLAVLTVLLFVFLVLWIGAPFIAVSSMVYGILLLV